MKYAIDKYVPYIKITFTILLALTILINGTFAVTDLSSTKRGTALINLGLLFGIHTTICLAIIHFAPKYTIYILSTFPLLMLMISAHLSISEDTFVMDEW